jgi:NitT/TauT family transport system ATP-binding protein
MNKSPVKLATRNLTKNFGKGQTVVEALRDISIDVRDGEFISVVGASGCGKTTFLRLVDGLISATSGSIIIDGKPVTKPGEKLAFVFQQDGLLPWRNVLDNALFGPEIQGKNRAANQRVAREFLKLVGISSFDTHYPHELSGGMRQRVNLARALAVGADVLLMDEPFAALDAQTRIIMQGELMRICHETQKTVLLVTHQIDEAVYLSDRVLVFTTRPGRLKEEVAINLPRPRDLSVKFSAEFGRLCNHIWRLIEEEVRASMGQELKSAVGSRH